MEKEIQKNNVLEFPLNKIKGIQEHLNKPSESEINHENMSDRNFLEITSRNIESKNESETLKNLLNDLKNESSDATDNHQNNVEKFYNKIFKLSETKILPPYLYHLYYRPYYSKVMDTPKEIEQQIEVLDFKTNQLNYLLRKLKHFSHFL